MALTLSERASDGVRALWEKRKFSQRELAKKIKRPPSVVNRIIKGTQPVTLRTLEAVGDLAGINPLEMLLDPKLEMRMVNPDESRILRYFRSWPSPTRLAFLAFASFFADEEPALADQRRAHEQLRALSDAKKRLVYGYLTFLTEGDLAPDILEGLGLLATDAPQSKRPKATPTRGKTTPS